MAFLHKRKDLPLPVPKTCHRCGEKPGTTSLDVLSSVNTRILRGADRPLWLCAECLDVLRSDAPSDS
jgi:hypothetical protein